MVGHLMTLFTVTVWGVTFISTKILLKSFQPVDILLIRFIMAYILLWILSPKGVGRLPLGQELCFVGAGMSGITVYYILENVALTYTQASNVGVIISAAPFFTAIMLHIFGRREEREAIHSYFVIGFLIAMVGICLISYNGATLHFDPLGDLLTILAACTWGVYAVFLKKINGFGFSVLAYTRRIFFYGLIGLLISSLCLGVRIDPAVIVRPINLCNLLFLGLVAGAICFLTWNTGVEIIGAMKSSAYIYLCPVITVIASVIVLHESITILEIIGTLLILGGLILSENWFGK